LLFVLYMSVFFISLSPSFSVASNICVCQCCEGGGRCGSNTTQAFTVYDSCSSGCTRNFCIDNFHPCAIESYRIDVVANCINRDTWVNPAVIVVFLLSVVTLVVLGIARRFSPKLKRYIAVGA